MSHFNFPKPTPVHSDNSKLIRKVDDALSEVVRLSAADKRGECICITCGAKDHWLRMQCGHYVKRAHMATRFDLQNCGVQCSTCNCVMDGMEEAHGRYIDATYGDGTAASLMNLALDEKKWMNYELEKMLKELRTEIKRLKQIKLQ